MLLAARRALRPASAVRLTTRGLSTSRVALGSRPAWSQVDAEELSAASPYEMENFGACRARDAIAIVSAPLGCVVPDLVRAGARALPSHPPPRPLALDR